MMIQQIIQHSLNCEHVMCNSDVALLNLCTIYRLQMSVKSYTVDFKQRLTETDDDSIIKKYTSYYTFLIYRR